MSQKLKIPSLVLDPASDGIDPSSIYAIATAYAHAGRLIDAFGDKADRDEFVFPAVVCSGFAIELFMKFFIALDRSKRLPNDSRRIEGHELTELWKKINPRHQRIIAGMLRNKSGTPVDDQSGISIELFMEALSEIGNSPFKSWRYIHELTDLAFISHSAVVEVVDALGYAAQFVLSENNVTNEPP